MIYTVGDVVELTAEIRDRDKILVDPDSVLCTVLKPDGSTFTVAVTNPAVGIYRAEVYADQDGTWRYAWDSFGYQAAREGTFVIHKRWVER